MDNIKNEILKANYWEHFKVAKDYRMIFSADNVRLKNIELKMNEIQKKITT